MNSPDVVDRLVRENQGLVVHFAKRHQKRVRDLCGARIGLADLIAEGKIGLAKAAQRFDLAKGFKFSTYATPWINKYLFKARFKRLPAVSLSMPIGNGEITLESAIGDTDPDARVGRGRARESGRASQLIIARATLKDVECLIIEAGLDDREMKIIRQRFGLDDGELKTQKQIAKNLGLTKQRISQLEKVARGKIAKRLGN
jgi:RNA polymerase sigma factor (sigma-70 family)